MSQPPSLLPHSCPPVNVAMGKGGLKKQKILGEKGMLLEYRHPQEPHLAGGFKCLRSQLSWKLTSTDILHNHPAGSALLHPYSRPSTCYPCPSPWLPLPACLLSLPGWPESIVLFGCSHAPQRFSHTQELPEGRPVGAGQNKEEVRTGGGGASRNPAAFPGHPGKVKASLLPTDLRKVILSSSSQYSLVTQTP